MKSLIVAFAAGVLAAHVLRNWIRAEVWAMHAAIKADAPLPRVATNITKL